MPLNTIEPNTIHPIYTLPKAELHIHIEGTLEPDLVLELAAKNNITLPFITQAELDAAYNFSHLDSFLALYYACSAVLQTQADFELLIMRYLTKAYEQGVAHAEIFFDPQAHMIRGVDPHLVIDGLNAGFAKAQQQYGITGGLIMCFLRDRPVEEAAELLDYISPRATELIGVGLDSSEAQYPPHLFTDVFRKAQEMGLQCVAHAGEEAPPLYIWQALEHLGAQRIDHGVTCINDLKLLDHLRENKIPLTVCPSSNVCLRVVSSWDQHPLPELLDHGLMITISSDDPAYFGGDYIGDVYHRVQQEFGLTNTQIAELALNSVDASFASAERKETLRNDIHTWLSHHIELKGSA